MRHAPFDIVVTLHDALGFAAGRFDDALRLAWLPLSLITGLPFLMVRLFEGGIAPSYLAGLNLFAAAFFMASFMVPLTRLAVQGEATPSASVHLSFGLRQIRFALVSLLSIVGAVAVVGGPVTLGVFFLERMVENLPLREVFVFDEGSLHGGQVNVLFPDTTGAKNLYILLVNVLFPTGLAYLFMRLFLWPFFLAAGDPGTKSPLIRSLRASAGTNGFRLFLVILMLLFVQMVIGWGAQFMAGLANWGASLVGGLLQITLDLGVDFGASRWGPGLSQGFALFIGLAMTLFVGTFSAGLAAGAAGSIIRQTDPHADPL
ncbi:MAG: hypothetical protein AAF788_04535 [Pseudomonadota bacterium]